jgi:tetratricopeptide (TPR) repeat protein
MVPYLMIGAGIFLRCAWLWTKKGNLQKIILAALISIALFFISIIILPPQSDGHKESGLAKAFFLRNDYVKAKTLALAAIKRYPENTDLYILLGRIAKTEGRMDQSMAYYHVAISINPDDFTVNYDLGMLYLDAGKPEHAINYLEKSLTVRRYAIGMLNLARAYEETSDKAQAINYYEKFMKAIGPDDPRHEFARNRISFIKKALN